MAPEGAPAVAPPMGLAHRVVNVLGVFVPVAGVIGAAVILWGDLVGPHDLVLTAVLYVLTGLGITVGFHRLFTHRSFDTVRPMRAAFAVLGSMSVQGPIISWVADHRKHHAFTDEEGDPHSPHLTERTGVLGALEGLWHAHVGWLFHDSNRAHRERYAPDLHGRSRDPLHRPLVPLLGRPRPRDPGGRRLGAWRRPCRCARRPAVGRPRADLPAAPRDVRDQLAVPLHGPLALRDR